MSNPFLFQSEKPIVAVRGKRNGYIMVASAHETLHYADIPDEVLLAAKHWAILLEKLGSPRVYWITLSEVTTHYHFHIFPRWPDDTLKGIPLFESRESETEPPWTEALEAALHAWALDYNVALSS